MRGLPSGGMRALPGAMPSGTAGTRRGGYAGGGSGLDVQPCLWILPIGGFVVLNGGAWLLDQLTAAWCHFEGAGCVSTHYLADLLHIYAITLACVVALIVGVVGCRRRWHVKVAWVALVALAWTVHRIRVARARRAALRRVPATTVRVVAVHDDDMVVDAEEDPPRALTAGRVEDVQVLIGGVQAPQREPR